MTSNEEFDFAGGFTGGHEGAGAWFTSGLSGLLLSKLTSDEAQKEWYVQRNSIDFGAAKTDEIIEAYLAVGDYRNYTQDEATELRRLIKERAKLERDLDYVYDNVDGDLDAAIDVDGNSFNDRWGVDSDDASGFTEILKVFKENPAYAGGVFTAEIIKDLPLSALAWLGLAGKGATGAKAITTALNKLNNIQPKILRGVGKLTTGIAAGTVAGATYEGTYSLLEQGNIDVAAVKTGAAFGAEFGVLG